jgi:uncharacterized cupin superfamily protein
MIGGVVPEAPLEKTDTGLVPSGKGWFVVNARDAQWRYSRERGAVTWFGDQTQLDQVGVNLFVLDPGAPMSMYHWEADQEDFLVLSGEALLVIESEERPLKQWDFVHCPPNANHTIIGAGDKPCVVLAIGARDKSTGDDWGGYPVDDTARKYDASAEKETTDPNEAYARFPHREPTNYRDGWLP